jgi:hypothetical protein
MEYKNYIAAGECWQKKRTAISVKFVNVSKVYDIIISYNLKIP